MQSYLDERTCVLIYLVHSDKRRRHIVTTQHTDDRRDDAVSIYTQSLRLCIYLTLCNQICTAFVHTENCDIMKYKTIKPRGVGNVDHGVKRPP